MFRDHLYKKKTDEYAYTGRAERIAQIRSAYAPVSPVSASKPSPITTTARPVTSAGPDRFAATSPEPVRKEKPKSATMTIASSAQQYPKDNLTGSGFQLSTGTKKSPEIPTFPTVQDRLNDVISIEERLSKLRSVYAPVPVNSPSKSSRAEAKGSPVVTAPRMTGAVSNRSPTSSVILLSGAPRVNLSNRQESPDRGNSFKLPDIHSSTLHSPDIAESKATASDRTNPSNSSRNVRRK